MATNVDDTFRNVVRALAGHPKRAEPFTLNQLAFLGLGKGDGANARSVGEAIHAYRRYFANVNQYQVVLNWSEIGRDHPSILPPTKPAGPQGRASASRRSNGPPGASPSADIDPIASICAALDDERRAVIAEGYRAGVRLTAGRRREDLGAADFIYEFGLGDGPSESGPSISVPDGAPVRIEWKLGPGRVAERDGILLAFEPREERVLVRLQRDIAFETRTAPARLTPRADELVAAVQRAVEPVRSERGALAWRLLSGRLEPAVVGLVRELPNTTRLDESQRAAVERSLREDILFIWGPPGTGKTHTLGELIAHHARAGHRVLALTLANVAIDQVCLATRAGLLANGPDAMLAGGRVLRLGFARDPEVLKDKRFFPDRVRSEELRDRLRAIQRRLSATVNLTTDARAALVNERAELERLLKEVTKSFLRDARVVLTTVLQLCLDDSFTGAPAFDVVVLDEASMVQVPHVLVAAQRARRHLVIAGDFRQLGPISIARTESALRWLHRDAFSLIRLPGPTGSAPEHPAVAMLRVQRRMHPDISACVNGAFYGGALQDAASQAATRAHTLPPFPGRGAVLVDLPASPPFVFERTPDSSRRNLGSASLAARLAHWYVLRGMAVAVITPYRAQVASIKDALKPMLDRSAEARRDGGASPHVGTIHTFQGSERDVVILDLVENRGETIGLLFLEESGDRLGNVAITRAKGKLVVLADPRAFIDAAGHRSVWQLRSIIAGLERTSRVPYEEIRNGVPL